MVSHARRVVGRIALAGLAAVLGLTGRAVSAQEPHRQQLRDKFQNELARLATAAPGVVGIAVVDISSGDRFGVNDGLVFPQGSAIKIPILLELFRRADAGSCSSASA